MNAYAKKKLHRLHCKRQVQKGLINNHLGEWVDPEKWIAAGVTIGQTIIDSVRAGNRVDR